MFWYLCLRTVFFEAALCQALYNKLDSIIAHLTYNKIESAKFWVLIKVLQLEAADRDEKSET